MWRGSPARSCSCAVTPSGRRTGFNKGFFLYKEEEDLCRRIRHAGGTVLYVPDARATHIGGVVAGRDPAQLAASTERYVGKHLPGRHRRVLELLYERVARRI